VGDTNELPVPPKSGWPDLKLDNIFFTANCIQAINLEWVDEANEQPETSNQQPV